MPSDPGRPQTARKLRVYGGYVGGQWRAIMACRSHAEVIRASRGAKGYGCETGNAEEISQAMSKPGVLFVRPSSIGVLGGEWSERERADTDDGRKTRQRGGDA